MKKKILNHIKVIIIILIGVTILFAILGTFGQKENMEDSPKCYSDVLSNSGTGTTSGPATYNSNYDDKYILKTKIIPPKGTSCPIEISGPASNYLNDKSGSTSTSIQSSNTSSSSNTSNSVTNITNATPVPADSTSSSPEQVDSINPTNSTMDNSALNDIKGAISQINQQKPSPETCPPCPACERCPEPAFDCKKVPNYRSPSIGQYLPLPVLNDFSSFN